MQKRNVITFLALKTIANFFIISGLAYLTWAFYPIMKLEFSYFWSQLNTEAQTQDGLEIAKPVLTDDINAVAPPLSIEPINTTNAIVIEKINVNTPIIFDVSVSDKYEYFRALEDGVAHARGTAAPSDEIGNTFLFAHSTPNPLEIKRYGAVFTLLNKLAVNDRVTIFFDGKRFDYQVTESKVVKSFDLSPLLDPVTKPTLTLQTCDPPGIPVNRLIVRAELRQVYSILE